MNPRSALGQLRRQAGYRTQTDAAKALGCSKIHLATIERGDGGASKELLGKMAQLYSVSLDAIEHMVDGARRSHFQRGIEKLGEQP